LIVPEFRFGGERIQLNQAGFVFGDLKDNSARARCALSARRSAASDLQFVLLTFIIFPEE
jgi:hypothetical protein